MKYFIILLLFASCKQNNVIQSNNSIIRAKVLESNTMTYVNLNNTQLYALRALDTVWVNLSTHTIDDTSMHTMKCVLYKTY